MNQENTNELQSAIRDYLNKGFGSMNKNDFEVFIFNELLKNEFSGKSDNAISRKLKIPESKVKRLRYEAELVYGESDHYKEEFYEILKNRVYKFIEPNKLQFSIKNKGLRLYLDDKLESNMSFADSSFNSDIVTITASDLLILIADFEGKNELIEKIKESIKETSKLLPKDLKEKCLELTTSVVKDTASIFAPNIVEYLGKCFVKEIRVDKDK